jgi:hypothetical protein
MNEEQSKRSRRRFLSVAGGALSTATVAGLLPRLGLAADLPHLDPSDPTAQALKYTDDAAKAGPPHQDGQMCSACNFFGGGASYGACQLFPGKSVSAKGWCSGYAKKA